MSTSFAHTAGPWRWEFNREHKVVRLVGGRPRHDLTIMDFSRWGMSHAVPNLRDLAHDGFNIMHRLCDRQDWIAPFPGREHHANWCASVTHADMVLIQAAPELLDDLVAAAATLRRYEVLHRAKGTADSDYKADANAALAARFEATIARATGSAA